MEFLTILIIFAILSRLFEAAKGGTKPRPGQPPQRRPQPRPPVQGGEGPAGLEPTGDPAEPVTAADMIPDELWELLTGQKRPPRPPPTPAPTRTIPPPRQAPASARTKPVRRRPLSAEAETRPVRDEEAELAEYVAAHTRDVQGEIEQVLAEREAVVAERAPSRLPAPRALDVEPPPEPERHRQFHEKIDRPPPVAPAPVTLAQGLGLTGAANLRRAFVLSEVLGPPPGLEEGRSDR